jgi:hypothetical protein
MLVEAIVTEGAIGAIDSSGARKPAAGNPQGAGGRWQRLDESVLRGFAGLYVVEDEAVGFGQVLESAADELGTVVGGDDGGLAALRDERGEQIGDGSATDGSIDLDSQVSFPL